ncbi:Vacuolar protein sorting-associated protein 13A [Neofusicoccum parvum]|uniref:Vacuolar protein sorting-associated protein 13A n=1 Tax=Neofusicoccum parvum TaxID=310453 RepID=A0ACB5SAK1_9PEZI|nr:Vacuolar protein sorting-associated protein 13A [Neofusicoccum parvum]
MRKEAMQGTGSGPSSYETGDMVKSAIGTTAVDKDRVLFDSMAPQYSESSNTYSGLTPSNSTSATTETLRPDSSASPLDNPYAAVAVSTGKGVARIIGAGLKAPATYTHGLAQGFNNMPRLYGDDTVRKEEKIDGFGSGLVAAGKGLGYGLFDGITGLVAQPVRGVQEEGAAGFFKGFGKGLGGLVCKPAAGACGIPGYAFMGVYKSLASLKNDKPTLDDLVAAEYVAQGEQELRAVEETEKKRILDTWRALDLS